eukprot:4674149-Prymnesium_polylepis.1
MLAEGGAQKRTLLSVSPPDAVISYLRARPAGAPLLYPPCGSEHPACDMGTPGYVSCLSGRCTASNQRIGQLPDLQTIQVGLVCKTGRVGSSDEIVFGWREECDHMHH